MSVGSGTAIFGSSAYLIATDEFGPLRHPPHRNANIPAIVLSALIFLAILAWANVIEHLFFTTFPDDESKIDLNRRYEHTVILFWYAVFWTAVAILGSGFIINYLM